MCRLFIILLVFPFLAYTQSERIHVNQPAIRFDKPEVLREAGVKSVRCIFKDSRGLMWFGTSNGLYRFDGMNTFYQRRQAGSDFSLPDNTITGIAEDRTGNMWIATLKGVARMNPYNFHCTVFSQNNGLLQGDYDCKVYVDESGLVWAGNNNGISLFDEKAGKFLHVWKRKPTDNPFYDYVSCITDYNKDTLAAGTFRGIFFLNKKNYGARFVPVEKIGVDENPVTAIFLDSRRRLWVGTWGNGLQIYQAARQKFRVVQPELREKHVVHNIVGGIIETSSFGEPFLWVSGSNGLVRLQVNDSTDHVETISLYRHDAASANSLPADASGTMYADESGNIWLASSNDKGIVKFAPDGALFERLPVSIKGTLYEIQPILLKQRQYYFASAWYHETGLTILDANWKMIKQFSRLPANSTDEATRNISGVDVDKFDRIWVSTLGGLTVLDAQFNVLKHFGNNSSDSNRLSKPKTNAVLINNDTVWVACYKKGIDLYDLNFRKLAHFEDNDNSGLNDNLVWKFFRDRHQRIWVCGNSKLYRYNSGQQDFTSFGLVPGNIQEGCAPRDIAELPDGNLLIASESGLVRFDAKTASFEYIRSPLLQKEDNILSVTVDAEGNAWYLTTEHLVNYNLKTKRFTLFGADDGLNAADGLQLVRSFRPGELIIGQKNQVMHFSYRKAANPPAAPQIIITGLQINDSAMQFAVPVRLLDLRHFQNKFYVEFAGINYTKADQNQFAYQLEGIDPDWVVTNKNFASYANLDPGRYTFKVKAANFAGNWGNEYRIALSIAPPFWETWWFIAIAIFTLGTIFILIVRYIAQRNLRERILVLEKEQAVEKERTRIASDMHDDLGSGLTKIAILSEVAKKQLAQPENAVRQLENISSSSRELVDNLQDIIWVLNPKNDSLDSLAAYIREYALKFFEAMDVKLLFEYPAAVPAVKLSEEVRRNIFLVIKETLNNTAKHANGKCIQIKLLVNGAQVELQVTDDGRGFERAKVPAFSNGLTNMRNRMEQIGGQYELNSEPGKGTVTKLVIGSISQ